ncbi:unnamed protein product [Darwinula stevensoni]|uniref:Kringle domain-containing protein n=1 Tax=Darwinula stevensoni TaxID=69355 RepID=A0A7R9FPN7_9CRUS|nr:unnamed protein product [Darwinula stevensoni]CAG0898187.1 unnamed protein product [Darwinula stevensoni]
MTRMGKEYRGTHSQTRTGKNCVHWKKLLIGKKIENIFGEQVIRGDYSFIGRPQHLYEIVSNQDLNYCRNPTSAEEPWCFVSELYDEWEFCNIPFCPGRKEPVECKLTKEGWEYAGFKNVDARGRKCQPWLTSDPKRFQVLNFLALPDQLMDYSNNYCRNPFTVGTSNTLADFLEMSKANDLWCFTEKGSGFGWGQCTVPYCHEAYERSALEGKPAQGYPECLQTKMGKEYVGTTRKTVTGKPCLRWDAVPYGKLDDFDPKISYDDHFRFGNAASHQDFCRNPTLKNQPWCFVGDPKIKWEFCDISMCPNYPSEFTPVHEQMFYLLVMGHAKVGKEQNPNRHIDKTECKWTHKGEEYAGTLNVTASGRPCLPWSDSGLLERFWPRFPEDVRSENHNFCRNPTGGKDMAYCFVDFGEKETCDIPFCPFHFLY